MRTNKNKNHLRSIKIFSFILFMMYMITSCNKGKIEEINNLKDENAQLAEQLSDRDSSLNNYLVTLREIEENLAEIKKKENLISETTAEDVEFDKSGKEQLIADIKAIDRLMAENRQKMDELQSKIATSNMRISEFKKMVNRISAKLEQKEQALSELREEVEELHFKNETLSANVEALTVKTDTLEKANQHKTEIIEDQKQKLNTAYYAMGTSQELKENNIITKEGGILGIGSVSRLNAEVDPQKFYQIDIKKTTSIPVMAKKAEIVTYHPEGTYKLETQENGEMVTSLVITDPENFWNRSKYLVVRVN